MTEKLDVEKAHEEAELLRKKVKSGEASNYEEAGLLVEQQKARIQQVIENAKNGETANLIGNLDLSTQEGRNKLRLHLSPWNRGSQEKGYRAQGEFVGEDVKILHADGKELFPFVGELHTTEHYLARDDGILQIEHYLRMYDSAIDEESRLDIVGHALTKIGWRFGSVFGVPGKGVLKELPESDPRMFLGLLGYAICLANGLLNGAKTSIAWSALAKMPKDVAEVHPNYATLRRVSGRFRVFYNIWNEAFYMYLSHVIHNLADGITHACDKTFLEDTRLIGSFGSYDDRISGPIRDKILNGEFAQEVEDEAALLLAKLDRYQGVLEDFISKHGYAKSQAPR